MLLSPSVILCMCCSGCSTRRRDSAAARTTQNGVAGATLCEPGLQPRPSMKPCPTPSNTHTHTHTHTHTATERERESEKWQQRKRDGGERETERERERAGCTCQHTTRTHTHTRTSNLRNTEASKPCPRHIRTRTHKNICRTQTYEHIPAYMHAHMHALMSMHQAQAPVNTHQEAWHSPP